MVYFLVIKNLGMKIPTFVIEWFNLFFSQNSGHLLTNYAQRKISSEDLIRKNTNRTATKNQNHEKP